LLTLWIVLSTIETGAQEESRPAAGSVRTCVFVSNDLSEGQGTEKYQKIITDALDVELRNLGLSIVPRREWRDAQEAMELNDEALLSGSNAVSVARSVNSQLAITGFYAVDSGKILIQIKCYSVKQNRLIASFFESARLGLALYNLISSAVVTMQPKVEEGMNPLPAAERLSDPRLTEVELLSADEGAEVYLNGEKLVGSIKEGHLNIYSIKGTDLYIELRQEGFHSGQEVIHLGEEIRHEHKMRKMIRKTRWASEILYTSGQMLGLGFALRYYFLPDELFLSLEDYIYVQHSFEAQSQPILHNDIRLLAGRYLFLDAHSPFRFGVSLGFGVILTGFSVPEIPVFTDLYINVLNGWVEWNLDNWILYLRVEGKYGIEAGENLLGGRWHLVGDVLPPMTLGVVKKW